MCTKEETYILVNQSHQYKENEIAINSQHILVIKWNRSNSFCKLKDFPLKFKNTTNIKYELNQIRDKKSIIIKNAKTVRYLDYTKLIFS